MLLYLVNAIDRICCECMILLNVVLDTFYCIDMFTWKWLVIGPIYIMFLYFLGIVYYPLTCLILYLEI